MESCPKQTIISDKGVKNMKYRYSKLAFTCFTLITGAAIFSALLLYGYFLEMEKDQFFKALPICAIFFLFLVLMYAGEYLNRYVEIFDERIRFNSFRFRRIMNPVSVSVKYEDIFGIKARKLPFIGLWGIKINARNLPHEITLSFCFRGHRQMFKDICEKVQAQDLGVIIDPDLLKYLEKDHGKYKKGAYAFVLLLAVAALVLFYFLKGIDSQYYYVPLIIGFSSVLAIFLIKGYGKSPDDWDL